jgi:hypothetical protein
MRKASPMISVALCVRHGGVDDKEARPIQRHAELVQLRWPSAQHPFSDERMVHGGAMDPETSSG